MLWLSLKLRSLILSLKATCHQSSIRASKQLLLVLFFGLRIGEINSLFLHDWMLVKSQTNLLSEFGIFLTRFKGLIKFSQKFRKLLYHVKLNSWKDFITHSSLWKYVNGWVRSYPNSIQRQYFWIMFRYNFSNLDSTQIQTP